MYIISINKTRSEELSEKNTLFFKKKMVML